VHLAGALLNAPPLRLCPQERHNNTLPYILHVLRTSLRTVTEARSGRHRGGSPSPSPSESKAMEGVGNGVE